MEKAEFGAFVAENRRRLGLTQKALADRLHVTDKAVSKWERGLSYPDVTLLEPLAAVLGIDVSELVSARRRESPGEGETGVRELLDISGELLRREQRRRRRALGLSVLAVLLAMAALALLGYRRWSTESIILSVIHTEERGEVMLLDTERNGHLLCLIRRGEGRSKLLRVIREGQSLRADYRWDRKTCRGRLLSWEGGGFPIGGPMGEVGAAADLNAGDGDALFGFFLLSHVDGPVRELAESLGKLLPAHPVHALQDVDSHLPGPVPECGLLVLVHGAPGGADQDLPGVRSPKAFRYGLDLV